MWKVKVLVTQSCLTLCDPMDLPGSSVQGISQARILECVVISFSRDILDPGIEPVSPALQLDSLPSEPSWNSWAEPKDAAKSPTMCKTDPRKRNNLSPNSTYKKTRIMSASPITSWQIDGEAMETLLHFIFLGLEIIADGDCSHEIKRCLLLGRKAMTNLDSILKSRDITLPTKIHLLKAMIFSNSYIWMWELDHKEGWALKNWCFWTVLLEKTLESLLDCKEIKPVNPKGNQLWIFIRSTDAKAESLILWLPDAKSWLIGKDLGKIEGRRRRGWQKMRWLYGITDSRHEFEQGLRDGYGQGSLVCCSPWVCKESDMTEQLNNKMSVVARFKRS